MKFYGNTQLINLMIVFPEDVDIMQSEKKILDFFTLHNCGKCKKKRLMRQVFENIRLYVSALVWGEDDTEWCVVYLEVVVTGDVASLPLWRVYELEHADVMEVHAVTGDSQPTTTIQYTVCLPSQCTSMLHTRQPRLGYKK